MSFSLHNPSDWHVAKRAGKLTIFYSLISIPLLSCKQNSRHGALVMSYLLIENLSDDSPLKLQNVIVGDVIIGINDHVIDTNDDISQALKDTSDNVGHDIVVYQNGKNITVQIPLGKIGASCRELSQLDIHKLNDFKRYGGLGNSKVEFKNGAGFFKETGIPAETLSEMKVSTTPFIYGREIEGVLEPVTAECVLGMNILSDFFLVGARDFFGGRSKTTQNALKELKTTALFELKKEAALVGGDAIVGVDLDYSEISGQNKSMLFLVASGTAVKLID